ncbi:cyclin-P [Spea bombifrons]|uniref:cyclin-P n=1 Tax=Spea bombifrons TaxID=233779 RepID=UPI00234B885B|nr:cyclin-P [Spea bombifrons]
MDIKREPFKTKDSNQIVRETGEKKKKSAALSSRGVVAAAGVNPAEKRAPESADGRRNPSPSAAAPAGPCFSERWEGQLARSMLRMDMEIEQEYAVDIFTWMMKGQSGSIFRSFDIPKSVTPEMRTVLVDWVVQVHEYLALEEETLYLAVYLMNSYLKVHKIQTNKLQLLASSCLYIACKMEEPLIPEPAELCFMMEDAFTKKELLTMEKKVLHRLRFQLQYSQPLHFLRLLAIAANCPEKVLYIAMYFMELTLLEAEGLTIEAALLASGALRLALTVSPEPGPPMPDGVSPLYSYSEAQLVGCQQLMARSALRADLKSSWQKYSRPQKLEVSAGPALTPKNLIRHIGALSTRL